MGVIANAVGTVLAAGASTLQDAQLAISGAEGTPMASVWASVGVLGRLFRTKEVQEVLACIASEEAALQQSSGPELLFGYRLAKRHVRDTIVAQSAEITDKMRNESASARGLLYKTIKEVCECDLGSGTLHSGRGELSMHGKALLALCARASKELENEGMRTRETTFREMERLRLEIARGG
jgi:hypothetical protein